MGENGNSSRFILYHNKIKYEIRNIGIVVGLANKEYSMWKCFWSKYLKYYFPHMLIAWPQNRFKISVPNARFSINGPPNFSSHFQFDFILWWVELDEMKIKLFIYYVLRDM